MGDKWQPECAFPAQGWFHAVYGCHRIRAAKKLGIAVHTIARLLYDRQLLVAQGRENAERRDISDTERTPFASSMNSSGFDRPTARATPAIDKFEMSQMRHVADAVPEYIARGRPGSWHGVCPLAGVGHTAEQRPAQGEQ